MVKTALFVVDIQAELVALSTAMPHASRIRESATAILNWARKSSSDLQIVFVQHKDSPDDPDASLVEGTKEWELVFPPQEDATNETLVSKTTRDTFESNPNLASRLKEQGVTDIVVFGVQSDFCVRSTSIGALNAGFNVVLLQGAHSTYDNEETGQSAEDVERAVEKELLSLGVRIDPWKEYII